VSRFRKRKAQSRLTTAIRNAVRWNIGETFRFSIGGTFEAINSDFAASYSSKMENLSIVLLLVSIMPAGELANFNGAGIGDAAMYLGQRCFNSVPRNQQKSMRPIGKSHLSMVRHKARHWRLILHKSLIIRLRPVPTWKTMHQKYIFAGATRQ